MSTFRDSPISKIHKEPYDAISPNRPELSQAGKTILIVGAGSHGVGGYIANSFARAGAATIILTGRREHVLRETRDKLISEHAAINPDLKIYFHTVDVVDLKTVAELWSWVVKTGLVVDVLVLSASVGSPIKTLLDMGSEKVWEMFEINSRSRMAFIEYFYNHDRGGASSPAIMLDVSSTASWDFERAGILPAYCISKLSGTSIVQMIAKDIPAETMRIISFHPGSVDSDGSRAFYKENNLRPKMNGDSPELSGNFALWLASPEAAFLHGRFVEAGWDVEELRSGKVRERIGSDPWFLKIGVHGLHP